MKRQVDYNKIATNISKYSFSFDLTVDETYENFSKEYPEIYNKIIQIYDDEDSATPFFINDSESTDSLLVQVIVRYGGVNARQKIEFRTSRLIDGEMYFQLFEYDFKKDIFKFTNSLEDYVTPYNVKSVFNQSIVGTGNINLFRHIITITTSSKDFILLEYISSNNLKVDSVQDLRTLCGNNFTLPVEGVHQVGQDTFSKVIKLVGTNTTLDYTTIKSDGTLQTLSALSGSLSDVVTTI